MWSSEGGGALANHFSYLMVGCIISAMGYAVQQRVTRSHYGLAISTLLVLVWISRCSNCQMIIKKYHSVLHGVRVVTHKKLAFPVYLNRKMGTLSIERAILF